MSSTEEIIRSTNRLTLDDIALQHGIVPCGNLAESTAYAQMTDDEIRDAILTWPKLGEIEIVGQWISTDDGIVCTACGRPWSRDHWASNCNYYDDCDYE